MIGYNKANFRFWSIMGINPSIWSVGFNEIISNKQDVAVFTADLERYSGLQRIFSNYPDKCFNLGIAEQNMVGVAAGMAMEGVQAYMTTYAPFISFRCADHIRHFMGDLHLDMKAIGSAAGLSAGLSGLSLLALSDIAFLRSIPGLIILSPADCTEAVKMMEAISEIKDPVYMRFCGAAKIPMVYKEDYGFSIGKGIVLNNGEGTAIIATGTNIVYNACKAAENVEAMIGKKVTVINMHTIKPLDYGLLDEVIKTHRHIVTVEEHFINGGLGSAVAEYVAAAGVKCRVHYMGIDTVNMQMGCREFMLNQFKLNSGGITDTILKIADGG